jgi:hypothetical protein
VTVQEAMKAFQEGKQIDYRPAEGYTLWLQDPFIKSDGLIDRPGEVGVLLVGEALKDGCEFRLRPAPKPVSRVVSMIADDGWEQKNTGPLMKRIVRAVLRDVREHIWASSGASTKFVDEIEKDFCGSALK